MDVLSGRYSDAAELKCLSCGRVWMSCELIRPDHLLVVLPPISAFDGQVETGTGPWVAKFTAFCCARCLRDSTAVLAKSLACMNLYEPPMTVNDPSSARQDASW